MTRSVDESNLFIAETGHPPRAETFQRLTGKGERQRKTETKRLSCDVPPHLETVKIVDGPKRNKESTRAKLQKLWKPLNEPGVSFNNLLSEGFSCMSPRRFLGLSNGE